MINNQKSVLALVLCFVLGASMCTASAEQTAIKQAEYNTPTSVMPSNWNEFT